jgi:hypothetical protein
MLFFEKIDDSNGTSLLLIRYKSMSWLQSGLDILKNYTRILNVRLPHFISSFLIYFIILVEFASIAFGGDSRADCSRSLFFIYQSFSILYGNVLRGSETIKKSRG